MLSATHSTEKVIKGHSKCCESACRWNATGSQEKLHLLMNTFLFPHKCFPLVLLSGELFCFFSKCTERTKVTKPHSSFMGNHKKSTFPLPLSFPYCSVFNLDSSLIFSIWSLAKILRYFEAMDFSQHLFYAQINRKWIGRGECISDKLPYTAPRGGRRYLSIKTPFLTYYAVTEIVLPACDRYERWHVISDCNNPELFDSWKTF